MTRLKRHDVRIYGYGPATIVCAHGFGCDQTMWRFMTPAFSDRYTVVTYDLVGSGRSDLAAYDRERYATLHAHAEDLIGIVDEFANGPVVVMGHSVGAIIGMLVTIQAPERFAAQVMVGPSPCYVNDGQYAGGFTREQMDELLASMDEDFVRWSHELAPAVMGAAHTELGAELAQIFCRNDAGIARHFARATFLSDHRADVINASTPALILQSREDLLAPLAVGEWMHNKLPNSTLQVIDNVGHCPHMTAPSSAVEAIERFLARALS